MLPLRALLAAIGCVGGGELLRRLFKPLGTPFTPSGTPSMSSFRSGARAAISPSSWTVVRVCASCRVDDAQRFVEAYRHYCWPVRTIDDVKLAPFHLLASASPVHVDKDHVWRSGSRRSSASSATSRYEVCTSACSACPRWRASPWTRGCKKLSENVSGVK